MDQQKGRKAGTDRHEVRLTDSMSLLHVYKSQEISPASTACKNWSESCESSISADSIDVGKSNRKEESLNYGKAEDETQHAGSWDKDVQSERETKNLAQREKTECGEINSRSGSTTPIRGWSALSPEVMKSSERRKSLSPQTVESDGIDASTGDENFQHLRQYLHDSDRSRADMQRCCNPSNFQKGLFVQLSKKGGFSSRGQRSDPNCVPTTSFPDLISSTKSAEFRNVDNLRSENAQGRGAFSSSEVHEKASLYKARNVNHIQGKQDPSENSSSLLEQIVLINAGDHIMNPGVSGHSGIISKKKMEHNTLNCSLGQNCGLNNLDAWYKGRKEENKFEPVQIPVQDNCNIELGLSSTQFECSEAEFVEVLGALTSCSGHIISKADEVQLKSVMSRTDPTASVLDLRYIDSDLLLPPTVGSPFHDAARSRPTEAIQQHAPTTKHVILEAIKEVPLFETEKDVQLRSSNLNRASSENLLAPIEDSIPNSIPNHSGGAKDTISVVIEVCEKMQISNGHEFLPKVDESPKTEATAANQQKPRRADKMLRGSAPSSTGQGKATSRLWNTPFSDSCGEVLGYDSEVLELKNDLSRALALGRTSLSSSGPGMHASDDGCNPDRKYRPLSQDSSEKIRSNYIARPQGGSAMTGNRSKSDNSSRDTHNFRGQQLESQRCKGVDVMTGPAARGNHAAIDLFHHDTSSLCCQNCRILMHRVSVLQCQLDVQVETSKKLATMCTVLRAEHKSELERHYKSRTMKETPNELHLQHGLSHASRRDEVVKDAAISGALGTHSSGRSIQTYSTDPDTECTRLREKLCLLQAQYSKDSIRAMKAKECSRLREVVQMLQTKLSLEGGRAFKAEKHLEKLKGRLKQKADTGEEQVCDQNCVDQNDLIDSLRDEMSQQKSIIQKLRIQNTLVEQQDTERLSSAQNLKDLEKRLGLYEAEIHCIRTKNAHLEEVLAQLKETSADNYKEAYRNEKIDADALKCALKQCEKSLSEKVSELSKEKADALKCALEQCEKSLSEKVSELSKEKDVADALKCALSEKVSELSKERVEADALRCAFKHCEKSLSEKVSELSKKKDDTDALKCALSEKVSEMSKERVEADALKCALKHCEKSLSEKVSELSKKKDDADALKCALEQCEESLSEKVSELSKLQFAFDDQKEKNKMLYCDLQDTIQSHQLLQKAMHSTRANEASLLFKMQALEREMGSKSYKLDQITQENRILQNRLESTQVQYEELEHALQELYARHLPFKDQDQTTSIAKDREEHVIARDSPAVSRAKILEKEIESHRLAFENCKCELEILRNFRTTAIQDQHERERKHSQELGALMMRLEEESAQTKAFLSEIAQLSSECCTMREKEAQTLHQHAEELAGLKQNQIHQIEKIKQDVIDCTNITPSSIAGLDHIFSERHKISVQLLRQKVDSYELELADNRRSIEQATLSMKESAGLIENLQTEIKARDAALEDTEEKNSLLEKQLLSALQSLDRAEIMIHELEENTHRSEERKTMLEASLFDLSRINLELTAALTESKAKLDAELRQRGKLGILPVFASETSNDPETVTSAVLHGLSIGPNETFDLKALEMGLEKPNTKTLIELLEKDPLIALQHLVREKDTILKILRHPGFSAKSELLDQCSNDFLATQRPKDYCLECDECSSLRKQIAEQEDELTTIQNEGESLKRQNYRLEHEIIRLKLTHERLKKEHRLVEGALFKTRSDNEILKSLQREILMEKENLIKNNSRLWSQLQGGRSGLLDGSNLVPESHVDLLFGSSNAGIDHGFLKDEEMAQRETNILVGLVQKLLHNRVSDGIDQ